MKLDLSISAKTVTRILAFAVTFLIIAGTIGLIFKHLHYPFPSSKWFYKFFNLDGEFNLSACYSTFTLLFCSGLLALIATAKKQQENSFSSHWKILSLIFLFLAIDELLSIHELFIIPAVRKNLHLSPFFYHTWVILGIAFVGIFIAKYKRFIIHLPAKTRFLFLLAGASYIGGALGMEMIGGFLKQTYGRDSVAYAIEIVTEEFLEMLGILIFIYALMVYLSRLTESIDIRIHLR